MTVSEVSKELLKVDPRIKFIGTLKNGNPELNFNEDTKLDENTVKLSIKQTPYIIEDGKRITDLGNLESIVFEYDNMKLYSLPLKDETITFGTNKDINDQEILNSISKHILGMESGTNQQALNTDQRENIEKTEKQKQLPIQSVKYNFADPWHRYLSNLIEMWKELAISSIHTNEKMLKDFWKNMNEKI